jgi:lysophospholipase L1-like esterase
MRSLPISLLAIALTVTFAHAQSAPPATTAAPAAPGAAAPAAPGAPGAPRAARPPTFSATPQPVFPIPPALSGPVTFNCGAAKKGTSALTASSVYSESAAGWDIKTTPKVEGGICSSDKPFYFSMALPEGNYRVTVAFGGNEESVNTVRTEARRLTLEAVAVKAKATLTKSFDVNTRVAEFNNPDGTPNKVRLKSREYGNLNWDNKLTIEFNGTNPSFHSIEITPLVGAKAEPVVYLAGDSTMVDQDVDPAGSWGQALPRFFLPGIVIANHAESGETSASFQGELRFPKIMSVIKPGDYFFMQFNHNDQKAGAVTLERYKQILTDFAKQVRTKGAIPVIVTAQHRRTFDASGHITNSLADYPQAARDVAAANNIALIDLTAMSKVLYEAEGPEGAKHLFNGTDITHFNNYGAYELARCVVHGIREAKLPIAKFLDPTVPDFDPAKFDPFEKFTLPGSPNGRRPGGPPIPVDDQL